MKKVWLTLLTILLMLALPALAEESVTVRSKNLRGYQENVLTVDCSAAGTLTLRVEDDFNVYRVLVEDMAVSAGKNTLIWDGLGYNQERLEDGKYRFHAELTTAEGEYVTFDVPFTLKKCRQALVFALSNGSTIYSDNEWYVEFRLIRKGRLVVEYYRADDMSKPFLTRKKSIDSAKVHRYDWEGKVDGTLLETGEYVLRFYAEGNPAYACDVPVTIRHETAPVYPLAPTGSIMPTPVLPDEELWALMTAPAVVLDVKPTTDYPVLDAPSSTGMSLGTIHGQSQTLEVLEVGEVWTKIAAWNHEGAKHITGWVPTAKLKVVLPNNRYGLLLDKQTQTLTVYEHGNPIGQLLVSTGKIYKKDVKRETAAGSFLCYEHMEDFSMNGKHYDYVIRFDGGNLLHQSGWADVKGKKDYAEQYKTLGEKASHGCVRIQHVPNEQGMNAYWLYTHIPANTRIIIMDDSE